MVPVRVVEIVPTAVVEIVPVCVVEIVPTRVVEIVPLLAVTVAQRASVSKAANETEFILFIEFSPGCEHQGPGRLKEVALGSLSLGRPLRKTLFRHPLLQRLCQSELRFDLLG